MEEKVIYNKSSYNLKDTILEMMNSKVVHEEIYINTRNDLFIEFIELHNMAKTVGKDLCDLLIENRYGKRCISLLGFSFGGLIIIYCLLNMYLHGKAGRGIVQNGNSFQYFIVILAGVPYEINNENYSKMNSVVSGTIVNGYSKKDWILAYGCRDEVLIAINEK